MVECQIQELCCHDPIRNDEGFMVCQMCGEVLSDAQIIYTPRKAYTADEIEKRRDHAIHGYSDRTSFKVREAAMNQRYLFKRLQILNLNKTVHERKYLMMKIMLRNMLQISELNMNHLDRLMEIYIKLPRNYCRGRSIETVALSLLQLYCKDIHVHLNMNLLQKTFHFGKTKYNRTLAMIKMDCVHEKLFKSVSDFDFFEEIINMANRFKAPLAPFQKYKKLYDFLNKIPLFLQGHDRNGILGSLFYVIQKREHLNACTQTQIAPIVNVTEVTIRNNMKLLLPYVRRCC